MDKRLFSLIHLADKNKVLVCTEPETAFIYYRDFKLNLLTGKKTPSSTDEVHELLEKFKLKDEYDEPIIIHLFYEFGFSCTEQLENLPPHKPLAIIIKYANHIYQDKNSSFETDEKLKLEITEYPSFEEYHKKFEKVYKHLIDGDCYQVNLTGPFYFKFQGVGDPLSFTHNIWNRTLSVGAYAHATYIDSLGKLYLSNSPECLFRIEKEDGKLMAYTMPIKGTIKLDDESERESKWKELVASKKDQAELYMITDLLRNDLTKICLTPAKVLDKKLPLFVPGLVHQFSKLNVELKDDTNLDQVVRALFPGGSITGAPKKRVMKIIHEVEGYHRGFYCGSTIVMHKGLKSASINIRSAVLDYTQGELFYGAGGGITLLSQAIQEFDESYAKMESFLHFLKVENVNKS